VCSGPWWAAGLHAAGFACPSPRGERSTRVPGGRAARWDPKDARLTNSDLDLSEGCMACLRARLPALLERFFATAFVLDGHRDLTQDGLVRFTGVACDHLLEHGNCSFKYENAP
jgi:hypothetical protein